MGVWSAAALWHGFAADQNCEVLTSDQLSIEIGHVEQQRLAGLTLRLIRDVDLTVDPSLVARLRQSQFAWASKTSIVEFAAAKVMTQLTDAGIDYIRFKGASIARQYSPKHLRPFADVDLLVKDSDYAQARSLIQAAGWAEDVRTRAPYDWMNYHCREGQNFRLGQGGVDLHHHIPPWLWTRRITLSDFRRSGIIGTDLPVEMTLIIASLHLVSDRSKPGQTLIVWRDLAELARSIDVQRLVDLSERYELRGWVGYIMRQLPAGAKPAWLDEFGQEGSSLPHKVRYRLLTSRLASVRVPIVQMFRLPIPNSIAYAVATLLPSPGYIRRRYGSLSGYKSWYFGPGVE